jgi:hypothetical protein
MENFASFEVKISSTFSSRGWKSIWGGEQIQFPFESQSASLLLFVRNNDEGEEIQLRLLSGTPANPGDPTDLGSLAPSESLTIQLNGFRALQAKCVKEGRDSKVLAQITAVS